jgi:energy-coupling factor transporter ATP-binding protein EcfA2
MMMMMITSTNTTPTPHALQPWQASTTTSAIKLSNLTAEAFGLIGKEAEFMQLLKHIEQGQSKLCLILGDAGIGKSTLLKALQQATFEQNIAGSFPAKCQLLTIDFLAYDATTIATESLLGLMVQTLTRWVNQIETHCLNLLNQQTPEGFSLAWTSETLAALITKANQQPSIAQRRVFLEVQIQTTLREQQNWVDKLFSPVKETVQLLVEALDNPWVNLLVDCQQNRLPNLVRWAEKRYESTEATQLFEKEVVGTLVLITDFFKQNLSSAANGEATLTLLIDNWDALLTLVSSEKLARYKAELTTLTQLFTEKKQQPFHVILATRTNDLGRSLGQTLYTTFRNKLLLSPFSPEVEQQFIQATHLLPSPLQQPTVFEWITQHAQGNPYWVQLLCAAVCRKTNKLLEQTTDASPEILTGWMAGLAVEHASDCHAFLLTQLQLGVVQYGVAYGQALQSTVSLLSYQPFEVSVFLEKVTTLAPHLSINDVALVLRKLFLYGCLKEVASTIHTEGQAPQYQVTHRLLLSYLKARLTQTRLGQQFNLMEQQETNWFEAKQQLQTLKTILPLTLEQGELTVEKVQGLLALTQQFQPEFKQEFQTFFISLLEETLENKTLGIELKCDALAGLAQLNQDRFLPRLLAALSSENATLQRTALTHIAQQGVLQGGHFASTQRQQVLTQLLAVSALPACQTATTQPLVLQAIEAWGFPLKQETKPLLLSFLQNFLNQADLNTLLIPNHFILLANRLLADAQLTEDERNALLPEVMTLVQNILQNDKASGAEALRLVKQYGIENTPEPLFNLLEKLAEDTAENTQPFAIQQEALIMLLVRLSTRENALQAWLEKLETDLGVAIDSTPTAVEETEALAPNPLLNKRIALASLQTSWPEWAKQQLLQLIKTQLNSRAWEAWLGQPDLLWVLLKCLLTLSPSAETTSLAKQWVERLQAPVFEEFEGLQLLGACLRGQLNKAV